MKKNKYILGGGITGLIFAFYNREYTIISPDLGGRLNQAFFKNIIYLHDCAESLKFLQDVGIDYERKTQLISYAKDNRLTKALTLEDKVNMIRKKLDDPSFSPTDLNLSTSDYYISILSFSYKELIEKISSKIDWIEDSIIRITEKEVITEKTSYIFDSLVSTLPANIFWKIYHNNHNAPVLEKKSVTFVLVDKEPDFCKNQNYDMVYFVDNNQKYTRISKKPGERDQVNILYEFTGDHALEDLMPYLPEGSNVIESYIDKQGIIYTNKNNIPPSNIIFIGRFSTWSHADKQQDVIKESLFDYDIRHIFNRQANFSKFYIDFNKLNDLEYKEQLTRDYLLHIQAELIEVLDEINYKHHKKRKKVNEEAVKEELIDVQKFLFNLMIVWGIDSDKFIEIFNRKSSLVEKRIKDEFGK